jgi:hypothetical protein
MQTFSLLKDHGPVDFFSLTLGLFPFNKWAAEVFHRNYGAKIPESHALLTVNRHGGTA